MLLPVVPQSIVNYKLKAPDGQDDERSVNLAMEKDGLLFRLDASKQVEPTASRFPTISQQELEVLRRVKNLLRQGRIEEITEDGNLVFQNGHVEEIVNSKKYFSTCESLADVFYVHCASPGPFAGKAPDAIFAQPNLMCLTPLINPPVPQSASYLAAIESARLNKTLNTSLIKEVQEELLLKDDVGQEDMCLSAMFQHGLGASVARNLLNLAGIQLILGEHADIGTKFLKNNRLSIFSIPGSKVNSYANLKFLLDNKEKSLTTEEKKLIQLYLPHVAKAE